MVKIISKNLAILLDEVMISKKVPNVYFRKRTWNASQTVVGRIRDGHQGSPFALKIEGCLFGF
jgi:hypothetical protein